MDRPYVELLRIQNYGCIKDAEFRFTRLHALIGPNDSGKSTVLRALKTLAFAVDPPPRSQSQPFLAVVSALKSTHNPKFFVRSSTGTAWSLRSELALDLEEGGTVLGGLLSGSLPSQIIRQCLQGVQFLRLGPDALRAPHVLIADNAPLRFSDERGSGLPALYDALVVRNLPALTEYRALNEGICRLFPSVKSIQMTNPSDGTKAISVKLVDDTVVPAELMSEGMLYYLAFAVLPYLDPTSLLLIEEPENGLHPARIAEVMGVLRAISEKTQVILATHSPLVINELQPEEVTVVTRSPEHGTKATPMKETADFEERSKVYALGELWLSYANGEDEAPLLDGGPRP